MRTTYLCTYSKMHDTYECTFLYSFSPIHKVLGGKKFLNGFFFICVCFWRRAFRSINYCFSIFLNQIHLYYLFTTHFAIYIFDAKVANVARYCM